MKPAIFMLVVITAFCVCNSRAQVDLSWLNRMLDDINRNVQRTQQEVDRTVKQQLAQVDRNLKEQMANVDRIVANAKSLPTSTNGQTFISSGSFGTSVIAGTGPDGKPYRQEIEDRVVNNIQYRTVWNFNSSTNQMDVHQWTRNLSDPTAPFVQVKTPQQN